MDTDLNLTLPDGEIIEYLVYHRTKRASSDEWLLTALRSLKPEPAVEAGSRTIIVRSQPGSKHRSEEFEQAVRLCLLEHGYSLRTA